MHIEPLSLAYVPDHFKTPEMCNEAVSKKAYMLKYVPDLKTQKMCEKAVEVDSWQLEYVPDNLKMQEM